MELDELVNPAHAALLVVDMQNDFCDDRGSLAAGGADPSMIQAMAPRLLRLLAVAREEERFLLERYAEYAAYARGVSRFVPGRLLGLTSRTHD